MKKILVSDYDKTFFLNDSDIKNNNLSIEKFQKTGNIFILATGRSFMDLKKVTNKYNIKYDYVFINHGSTILDKDDNIIFNSSIDESIINDLISDLKLNKSINNFFCSLLESRVSPNHKDITKINVEYDSEDLTNITNNIINEKYKDYINTYLIGPKKIEIVSKNSSKLQGIKFLEKKENFDKNYIYTIGDGYSDLEMIKYYNGYCIKNSVSEIKNLNRKEYESVSDLVSDILNNS